MNQAGQSISRMCPTYLRVSFSIRCRRPGRNNVPTRRQLMEDHARRWKIATPVGAFSTSPFGYMPPAVQQEDESSNPAATAAAAEASLWSGRPMRGSMPAGFIFLLSRCRFCSCSRPRFSVAGLMYLLGRGEGTRVIRHPSVILSYLLAALMT